jgi:hypothetical protein
LELREPGRVLQPGDLKRQSVAKPTGETR